MSGFKPYPAYKDSGVEWLGEVPERWTPTSLKYLALLNPHKSGYDGDTEQLCSFLPMEKLKTGTLQLDEVRPIEEVIGGYTYFEDGDVLQAKVTPCFENKNVAIASGLTNGIGFGSSEINVFRPYRHANAGYLYYRVQEDSYMGFCTSSMIGAGGLKRVPTDVINNFKVAAPELHEQTQIAHFLDHETARIDALIAEQQRLIELLKEKRQAVISYAVTKGLDPRVTMKDSGVEWLSEVPEHWGVVRVKHIKSWRPNAFVDGPFGTNLKSEHFVEEGGVYVIESSFATTGQLNLSDLKQITSSHFETIRRSEVCEGDIVIAKIGARYGMCSILPSLDKPGVVSGNSLKLTVNELVCDSRFAVFVLKHLKECGAIEDIVNMTAQPALSLGEMNNLPFPLPPLCEQLHILSDLEMRLGEFEALTSECKQVMGFAMERRSALISAAVTGKIDVRGWQPSACLETPELEQ